MPLDLSRYGIDLSKIGMKSPFPIAGQTSTDPKGTTAPTTQNNPITNSTFSSGMNTYLDPMGTFRKPPVSGTTKPDSMGGTDLPAIGGFGGIKNPFLPAMGTQGQTTPAPGAGAGVPPNPLNPLSGVMPTPIAPSWSKEMAEKYAASIAANQPQNTNVATATPASLGKGAYVEPKAAAPTTPQNTDVATQLPAALGGQKTINTKTGEAAINGKTVGTTADPNNKNVDVLTPQPGATTPGQAVPATIQSSLSEFEQIARNWMLGKDDSVFRVAANRVIDQLALLNQAERDAMQMQINQDPSLRGQGAGRAMLEIMARNQNFKAGDVFAQLAQESQERILDLQKYGWEKGLQIEGMKRARSQEGIQALISAGNFTDAAKQIEAQLAKDGFSGITIDPKTLQGRDQYSISQFGSRMQTIKELATVDPAAATAMLAIEMANPANKGWFPEGAKPEQFIETLLSTGTLDALQKSQQINTEINRIAASPTAKFSEASGFMKELFRSQRRDPIDEGRKLSIEDINKLRTAEKLPGQYSVDAAGNIVDETGLALTDEDFTELAYMAEWQDRREQAQKKPWDTAYELIMSNPQAGKFLDEENFPGGKDALKSFLFSYFMDTGAYSIDPQSGLPVPDPSATKLPWDNPKYYPMFFTWPKAAFDASGNVVGKYDMGGDVYGETFSDGAKVMSSPEDDAMDKEYSAYVRSGGTLTAPQWYFASAGGTRNPDLAKVPTAVSNPSGGENFLKVGAPGTGETFDPPKTIADEKTQLAASLKPSQKPPEDKWTKQITGNISTGPFGGGLDFLNSRGTETFTGYWNPDTGKYERSPNEKYRILYG